MTSETATSDTLTAVPPNVVEFSSAVRRVLSGRTAGLFETIPDALKSEPSSSTAVPQFGIAAAERQLLEAERELQRMANLAGDEVFEDGVENEVSRTVPTLVARFGSAAVDATARLYLDGLLPTGITCEVLRWLGRVEHDASQETRFWFLIYCLRDGDPRVRSASALALASLEDHHAVKYLRRQRLAEPVGLLRARFEKVANELEG